RWAVRGCGCCRCFFFSSRRRHTRSYGDWSSDVCSSDLMRRRGTSWCMRLNRVIREESCHPESSVCEESCHPEHSEGSVWWRRDRSEERRVGKECRCGGWPED